MKTTLISLAAVAAVATASVADHGVAGAAHRSLGRRMDSQNDTEHHLEARASKSAKAKAAAAAKAKAAAVAKSKAAAASKSKASALSKSKSLASKSKSLASKASSLAKKSSSLSKSAASAASKASASSASLSKQSAAAASTASALAAAASRASSASASIESAAASVKAAQSSLAAQQSSMSAQQASLSANAASLASAVAAETSVAGSNARSASAAAASASAAAVSAIAAASSADKASASIVSAQASLSAVAATLTASAQAVSASSVAVDASASVVSDRSVAIDAASADLDAKVDSITKSFAQVSSALSDSSVALAASTAALGISISSVEQVAAAQATTAAALASSAADIASQTSFIASVTSSLAAQATATGIATACQLGKYLGNGHCYTTCPAAYPVQFDRQDTFGLCCTEGAQECVNAGSTAATVCNDQAGYLLTILDTVALTGTCTQTCSTVSTDGKTAYAYTQLGGVYPECVAEADCEYTADETTKLCCPKGEATCADQTTKGALTCSGDNYFNLINATAQTGSCDATCTGATPLYSADNKCVATGACNGTYPVLQLTLTTTVVVVEEHCCTDPFATACTADIATACGEGYALTADGKCVAAGSCSDGNGNHLYDFDGFCCTLGATTCSSAQPTGALTCGLANATISDALAGTQFYLSATNKCVETCKYTTQHGTSGDNGYCCHETGATNCSSTAFSGHSTACDATQGYFLSQTVAGVQLGSCSKYCQDADASRSALTAPTLFVETVGNNAGNCTAACTSGSSYPKAISQSKKRSDITEQICCPANAASCSDAGVTTCNTGFFLQPDGSACLKDCPATYVKSSSGNFCCAAGTKTCSGIDKTGDASVCQSDYFLLDSTCVAQCPTGTVSATANGAKVCNCVGSNVATCSSTGAIKTCATGYSLFTPDATSPIKTGPSCQLTPNGILVFDTSASVAGATKCPTPSTGELTCNTNNGYIASCASGFALSGSAGTVSATCSAFTCNLPGQDYDATNGGNSCACVSPLAANGASCSPTTGLKCASGYKVSGTGASATCAPLQCPVGTGPDSDDGNTCACPTMAQAPEYLNTCDASTVGLTCQTGFYPGGTNTDATCTPYCNPGVFYDATLTGQKCVCPQTADPNGSCVDDVDAGATVTCEGGADFEGEVGPSARCYQI